MAEENARTSVKSSDLGKSALATEEEVVANVMAALDELWFSRLLIKSLFLVVMVYGVGAILKGAIDLALSYLPLLYQMIF